MKKREKGLLYGKNLIEKFSGGTPGVGMQYSMDFPDDAKGQWRATRLNTGNGQWAAPRPAAKFPTFKNLSPFKVTEFPALRYPLGSGRNLPALRNLPGVGGGGGNYPAVRNLPGIGGGGNAPIYDHKGWTPPNKGLDGTWVTDPKGNPGSWKPKYDISDANRVRLPMNTAAGISPFAGAALGASLLIAAATEAGPHQRKLRNNMYNPRYDTESTPEDYTQNAAPGQQVGTGDNIGLQPEYVPGYRYGEATPYFQGYGQRKKGTVNGEEVSPYPNNRIGIKNRITDAAGSVGNFLLSPLTGLGNLMGKQYNDMRNNMEAPKAPGEAPAAFTPYKSKGTGEYDESTLTQQGGIQRQGTEQWHTGTSVKKEDWTDMDDLGFEVLGVDKGDKKSVSNLQAFLVNSGINVGGFGETGNGVDGDVGNMTRGGMRDFMTAVSSKAGIKKLISKSPYLHNMYTSAFGKVGGTASTPEEAFMQSVASAIKNGDGTTSTNVQYGTQDRRGNNISVNRGKTGEKNDKTPVKGLDEVTVSQQGKNTSNKDAYEKSSNQGTKTYKDKDGKEQKTGKQGAKYENRNKKKKSKTSTTNTHSTRGQAFKAARAAGKTTFVFGGKKFNTRQANESKEEWKRKMNKTASKSTVSTVSTKTPKKTKAKTVEIKSPKKEYGKKNTSVFSKLRKTFKKKKK